MKENYLIYLLSLMKRILPHIFSSLGERIHPTISSPCGKDSSIHFLSGGKGFNQLFPWGERIEVRGSYIFLTLKITFRFPHPPFLKGGEGEL